MITELPKHSFPTNGTCTIQNNTANPIAWKTNFDENPHSSIKFFNIVNSI